MTDCGVSSKVCWVVLPSFLVYRMRMITGGILILAAEQAFAHAYSAPFPNQVFVCEFLLPTSLVLAVTGVGFLVWGVIVERKTT